MARTAYCLPTRQRLRFTRPLNTIYLLCMLLDLGGCSVTTAPFVSSAVAEKKPQDIHSTPVVQATILEQPTTRKASAEQCSVVEEKPARGSCFHPVPGGHDGHGHMCQPQSIPYARCRSQISSCNLGNTSPVELFNCEQKRGYTSAIPQAGALMSIGVNQQHHMTTGHTLYVEEVCPNPDGTYKLRVSHTNYDRQCHLEEDVWVHYHPQQQYADFNTGHWAAWGKHLPIQGFILPESLAGENKGHLPNVQQMPAESHVVAPQASKKAALATTKTKTVKGKQSQKPKSMAKSTKSKPKKH